MPSNFFRHSIFNRIPPFKYLGYFVSFLLLLYFSILLISDVSDRTRDTLLAFTMLGFIVSYYLVNPFIRSLNIHRPTLILLISILLVTLFVYAFQNNDFKEALLKCFFFLSGISIYLYLKYLFFKEEL